MKCASRVSLQYNRGNLFGLVEKPERLTKTLLGTMVKCLNCEPKILSKMIPVAKSEATFYIIYVIHC